MAFIGLYPPLVVAPRLASHVPVLIRSPLTSYDAAAAAAGEGVTPDVAPYAAATEGEWHAAAPACLLSRGRDGTTPARRVSPRTLGLRLCPSLVAAYVYLAVVFEYIDAVEVRVPFFLSVWI